MPSHVTGGGGPQAWAAMVMLRDGESIRDAPRTVCLAAEGEGSLTSDHVKQVEHTHFCADVKD